MSDERKAKAKARPRSKMIMDDPEQSLRFIEAARELGCEEVGEAFQSAIERILPPRQPRQPAPKREPRPKPAGRRHRTKGAG